MTNRNIRPFQSTLIITDGIFYDTSKYKKIIPAFNKFHVSTLAVAIGFTKKFATRQRNQLSLITNKKNNILNLGINGFDLILDIKDKVVDQILNNFYDNDKNIIKVNNLNDNFCGWSNKVLCLNDFHKKNCKWSESLNKCLPINSCKTIYKYTECKLQEGCAWYKKLKRCKKVKQK